MILSKSILTFFQLLCRYDATINLDNSNAEAIMITSVLAPANNELNPNTE